jgi:hypothetical protein
LSDTSGEPNETVLLALSGPTNAFLGIPTGATLTIADDDAPVAACSNLLFLPSVITDTSGLETTLIINIINFNSAPADSFDLRLRVYKNTNESWRSTSASAPLTAGSPNNQPGFIEYSYLTDSLPSGSYVVTATYAHRRSVPPLTDDDVFRIRFSVEGLNCSFSGAFPVTTPNTGTPPTVTIAVPAADDQLFTDADRMTARFQALISVQPVWVHFRIIEQATGAVVWDWTEFYDPYCAFGNDETCSEPPSSWWAALPDGDYLLEATARVSDGGSATAVRPFRIQH